MEGRPQDASRSRSREEGARGRETAATVQVHRAGQDGPPEGPTPELPHVPRYLGTYLGTDMCRQQLSGVWKGEGMDRRDAGHAAIPSQANEIVGDARVGPQSWLAG